MDLTTQRRIKSGSSEKQQTEKKSDDSETSVSDEQMDESMKPEDSLQTSESDLSTDESKKKMIPVKKILLN